MHLCFIALLTVMAVCGVRVSVIATDENLLETAQKQSKRSVTVALLRGTIYDCNGIALTNTETESITVVFPCEQGAVVLTEMLNGNELETALNRLSKGNPVTIKGRYLGDSNGAVSISVPKRYSGVLTHVIGYVDGSSNGVSGIEKGMNDVLKGDSLAVTYKTDTTGKMLVGEGFQVVGENLSSVTLTVDLRIQEIVENAMKEVESGAAVVLEAESGKVKAMVSRPDYDPNNVSAFLDDVRSPLLNRALCTYNVGSVFKPCVAAAALENGFGEYCYKCVGSIKLGNLVFRCNHINGHGELDLKGAVAMSCNTFFYTLATKVGAVGVYKSAESLRFGKALDLGGGIVAGKGFLPSLETLQDSPATLVNLSIGQGELLLSPVAVANLYATIVNGGSYRLPSIIEGVTVDGVYTAVQDSLPTRAMSKKTAQTLKDYLKYTLQNGTGSAAYVEGVSAGGKTGTAQTGWKDGDRKILNGWFCGFVECETTDYVIVVLKEDVKSGSHDCAPIFKGIAERLNTLK